MNSGRAVAVLRTAASSANASSNYSNEPMTLVEFVLTDAEGGVLLTVTESGFDGIPLARRAAAFSGNDAGWTKVVTLIETYVAQDA